MRRLTTFQCEGDTLGASIDGDHGDVGLLMVTGGTQSRIGSHRMYERLARSLAEDGFPCLRFDRRGVGDSEGPELGFREATVDIAAAAAHFRREMPTIRRLIGFGLCDGASALALSAGAGGLGGLILVNPWLVEAAAGEPPPAAIGRHYRDRLLSLAGWRRLLTGRIDWRKAAAGVAKLARSRPPSSLAEQVATGLRAAGAPVEIILARSDATAVAAEAEIKAPIFKTLVGNVQVIATDSHTFARPSDERSLFEAVRGALGRLAG